MKLHSKGRVALILGITGQDGAYLAKYLLGLGYTVLGSSRDAQMCDKSRLRVLSIQDKVNVVSVAPNDFRSVLTVLIEYKPDEIYNLAGQTSVGLSFSQPIECNDSICNSLLTLLEAIRFARLDCKLFNAGSTECFGDTGQVAATETTQLKPRSPYAIAKSAAYWHVACFRDAYNVFCCTGILGNHESPLRAERFVTMKIARGAVNVKRGTIDKLHLGRLDIIRDWGWAPDYVKAMHLMLQSDEPKDYIIATGRSAPLAEFVNAAFGHVGLDPANYICTDAALTRPNELVRSAVCPALIAQELGWSCSTTVDFIASSMVNSLMTQ